MTDIERFNLYWLCHAMTAPVVGKELYYYDGLTRKFFVQKLSALFDMIDLPLIAEQSEDFCKRMAAIDSEASEIVEIPRLNVQDKISMQLLFLSKFTGVIHEKNLRLAATGQRDMQGFVLDQLAEMDEALAPVVPYWESFKLKSIQYYLERYTGMIGITLKLV